MSDAINTSEWIVGIPIAILIPFFFTKLVNKVSGYDDKWSECHELKHDTPERKQCDAELDAIENKKQFALLGIAMATIIGSTFIQSRSTKMGVGFGGILTLITTLTLHWNKYGETEKLVILGLCLTVTIVLSMKIYNGKDISDMFSF
jgi:hypothetical protein